VFRKFLKSFTFTVLVFFLSAAAIVQPASATSPEDLNFTMKVYYSVGIPSATLGTWESSGLLQQSGGIDETVRFAGWTEAGMFIKNIQGITKLSNANGTIKIKSQLHEDFLDFSTYQVGVNGTWTVMNGTGVYAGLHGQGTVNILGQLYPCTASPSGLCLVETRTYTGQGHFEP